MYRTSDQQHMLTQSFSSKFLESLSNTETHSLQMAVKMAHEKSELYAAVSAKKFTTNQGHLD